MAITFDKDVHEHLREALLHERTQITVQTRMVMQDALSETIESDGIPSQGAEREEALQRILVDRMVEIEQALDRLDDGKYGTCAQCGKDIPPRRLQAQPLATMCIDCQRDVEKRKR